MTVERSSAEKLTKVTIRQEKAFSLGSRLIQIRERDDGSEEDGGQEFEHELVLQRTGSPKYSFDPPASPVAPFVVTETSLL